jgi:hypothetical protein
MSLGEFVLGVLRLAAIVLPAYLAARRIRSILVPLPPGAPATLADVVTTLSVLLIAGELLGLVGLFGAAAMIVLLWGLAAGSRLLPARSVERSPGPERSAGVQRPPRRQARFTQTAAATGVVVVVAQWLLQSANALGAGMLNFDTLWYHMPFAADFARSGSVTAIRFTQADPYVAFYPANSELLHALGIVALRGDFLSPLLNLLWLALALLAAWCIGRRWQVEPLTLLAGALVLSLPVLSDTQPGEAFNDTPGLACLLAAAALILNADESARGLIPAGLALGLAAGTKLTFLVPVAGLILALIAIAPAKRRRAVSLALLVPAALSGGWWYLRNLIAVGNPLGLGLHIGPLKLPGPRSELADAASQTVVSEIGHLSLWGSRFLPGLGHAIGPLWPLVAVLFLLGVLGGLLATRVRRVRALALVAGLSGISYLVLPTGASGIVHETTLFEVNLRYAMPALALAIPLVAVLVRLRAQSLLGALAALLLLILLAAQLEHPLWPTQTARHFALIGACGTVAALLIAPRRAPAMIGRRGGVRWIATGAALTFVLAAAFAAQRHYFARRYLGGFGRDAQLGTIYRWAQGIAHARLALYGSVEQYPLYGSRATNAVDYLGEDTADGGYAPISSCSRWHTRLASGRYAYVVLTPAPTSAIPLSWTAQDPGATLVINPAPGYYVFDVRAVRGTAPCR